MNKKYRVMGQQGKRPVEEFQGNFASPEGAEGWISHYKTCPQFRRLNAAMRLRLWVEAE